MKPTCLIVAMLTCSPVVAWAQTPPAPPAPPAPVVAPVRPVPPVPPAAPEVPSFVLPAPVIDSAELAEVMRASREALRDIDFEEVAREAMRASREALRDIDIEEIKAKALQNIDMQAIKEQAAQAKEQAKEIAAQAKELSKNFSKDFNYDFNYNFNLNADDFKMEPFAFQLRGRGPGPMIGRDEGGLYNSGFNYVARRQYDQAISRFDQVIAQKGARVDGALYWKAYAQYKLGKTDDALATIAALRRDYGQSQYLADARVLEADVRKSGGKPAAEDDNDEIKLLAISSLQNSNPDTAVGLLEGVLKATNSPSLKRRALFVLARNDRPAAHQLLLSYAKGAGNPDVQIDAIRYLAERKQTTTTAELDAIYNSTQDLNVRMAVLDALLASRDRNMLIKIAGSDAAAEIRRRAISSLGGENLMTPQELYQLYQKEENRELKLAMVRALGSMGAADQLAQVIKNEKEPSVRMQAIRSLGSLKPEVTGPALIELYGGTQDKDLRKTVISALSSQNNAEGLIAIARKETASDLKLEIVRRLGDLAPKSKPAMDYMMEILKN